MAESLHVALEKYLLKKNPNNTHRTKPKQFCFGELLLCPMLRFEIMSYFMAISLHAASSICHSHIKAATDDLRSDNIAVGNILMLYFFDRNRGRERDLCFCIGLWQLIY